MPNNQSDKHSWHLYTLVLNKDSKLNRDDLISFLSEKDIGTSVHYKPLHMHSYWKNKYNLNPTQYPISSSIYKRILSIPIYPLLDGNKLSYICDSIKEAFKK